MAALPLQRIEGKYEILEKIREGGMGAIYKVRHRLLDEIRVIKLMRQQLVEDEELKARFVREARLAIKLRHPNIAQLYDFTVDDDGTALMVMEFIDGMTLEDVLALHGPPPPGFALEVAQQSLKALGYLHAKGLIHRDISPDNLMLAADAEGEPQVKLIDLGIAKILGGGEETHLTQTGTFLGKIRYAPPEQFGSDGAAMVDARGDLYSFGIVLYELLTARFPIQGKDPSSLIAGHLFRPPLPFEESDPGRQVPAALRAVVLKALAKQPEERFASAPELAQALAAFRSPGDIAPEDLRRLLTRPFVRAGAASVADPGSTQERLDQSFNLEPTPSSGVQLEAVPPLAPAAPSGTARNVAAVAGTVALHFKEGDEETFRAPRPQSAPPAPPVPLAPEAACREPAAEPPSPRVSPTPSEPAVLLPAPPMPSRATPWKLRAGLAVAGALLLSAVVFFVTRHAPDAAPAGTQASPVPAPLRPPPPSVAAPLPPGTLVLDAVPWGEVTAIVDAEGRAQPLGAQRYTPLVLSLPPGRYTVTVRNPSFPRPVEVGADVRSGAEVSAVAQLGAISEEEFFKGMGW